MGNIIINAIGILLLIWLGIFLYYKFNPKAFDKALGKQLEKSRDMMKKESVLGKRMTITRENGDIANVIVYDPHLREKTPIVFVLHGGQFVDGDADQLDSALSISTMPRLTSIRFPIPKRRSGMWFCTLPCMLPNSMWISTKMRLWDLQAEHYWQ